jgi:hypothetical protein
VTPQEIIDTCTALDVELSEWQRNWIHNWIAVGRPKGLYSQYEQSWRKPVNGTRKIEESLSIH